MFGEIEVRSIEALVGSLARSHASAAATTAGSLLSTSRYRRAAAPSEISPSRAKYARVVLVENDGRLPLRHGVDRAREPRDRVALERHGAMPRDAAGDEVYALRKLLRGLHAA